jgi:assimilatory nitrate reductase catalytic subunit
MRGAITLQVEAGDDLRPGQAFLPMHWGSAHLGGAAARGINGVTLATFDAVSRQPELKHCAVRITKVELPWRLVAFAYAVDGDALALAQAVRRWLPGFAFATCVLVGREREGVLFRAASPGAADAHVIDAIDALFGLADERTLRYDDTRRGVGRRVRVSDGSIGAVRLAGDLGAEPWLRELFDRQEAVLNLGAMLLAPTARVLGALPRGKTVCSCWNVSERAICDFVASAPADGNVLAALQGALKCGTECGSCVPELKRLVATAKAAA